MEDLERCRPERSIVRHDVDRRQAGLLQAVGGSTRGGHADDQRDEAIAEGNLFVGREPVGLDVAAPGHRARRQDQQVIPTALAEGGAAAGVRPQGCGVHRLSRGQRPEVLHDPPRLWSSTQPEGAVCPLKDAHDRQEAEVDVELFGVEVRVLWSDGLLREEAPREAHLGHRRQHMPGEPERGRRRDGSGSKHLLNHTLALAQLLPLRLAEALKLARQLLHRIPGLRPPAEQLRNTIPKRRVGQPSRYGKPAEEMKVWCPSTSARTAFSGPLAWVSRRSVVGVIPSA